MLSLWWAEWAISLLTINPVTSPNDHSPVKPGPGGNINAEEDDSEIDISGIEDYNWDQLEECDEDKLCNPEYMEMDGTYDHNIHFLLRFTYVAVPESICNHHVCNKPGPTIRNNALNRFKNPLEACAVAGGLNSELMPRLTFY